MPRAYDVEGCKKFEQCTYTLPNQSLLLYASSLISTKLSTFCTNTSNDNLALHRARHVKDGGLQLCGAYKTYANLNQGLPSRELRQASMARRSLLNSNYRFHSSLRLSAA